MPGKVIRAISKDLSISAVAIDATDIVEKAREIHGLTSLSAAALGRSLSAASMMGLQMKESDSSLTLQIVGDGPLGKIVCVADSFGNVKGYVQNPKVELPLRADGHIDVAGGVGKGILCVIKDLRLKEPFIGQVPLVSGEIAEDITGYFAGSQQVPTVCALGVLISRERTVIAAGGYIIQLLPGTPDAVIDLLEKDISETESVTKMLSFGLSPLQMLQSVMKSFELDIIDDLSVAYICDCSREKIENALIAIGKKELEDMIIEDGEAHVTCQFCNKQYYFTKEDLESLLNGAAD